MDELLQPKEKGTNLSFLVHIVIENFVLGKGTDFHKATGIWKGKYAYLNLVYFSLAYI